MTLSTKPLEQIIDQDIRYAETLPAEYYREPKYFDLAKERIFARSWQFLTDTDRLEQKGQVIPWVLLDECLNEPLLLTRDSSDAVHCMGNVCTHRGNLLVEMECHSSHLRCRYHGRRFGLDGSFISAPGFEEAENFPTAKDNIPQVPLQTWGKFIFASLFPAFRFDEVAADMMQRLAWLPLKNFQLDRQRSCDYELSANWALYVENYLEGLHVPYVHPGLATKIDIRDYRYEVHKYSNLQIGIASRPEDAFEIPEGAQDEGQQIAAYYYWLFPNMMFNFHPWGLSLNIIIPLAHNKTRVRYLTYSCDESKLHCYSPDTLIEKTEKEDQSIVEQVQKGIQSRLYSRGRYSPQWEVNVHHFHSLLTSFLST